MTYDQRNILGADIPGVETPESAKWMALAQALMSGAGSMLGNYTPYKRSGFGDVVGGLNTAGLTYNTLISGYNQALEDAVLKKAQMAHMTAADRLANAKAIAAFLPKPMTEKDIAQKNAAEARGEKYRSEINAQSRVGDENKAWEVYNSTDNKTLDYQYPDGTTIRDVLRGMMGRQNAEALGRQGKRDRYEVRTKNISRTEQQQWLYDPDNGTWIKPLDTAYPRYKEDNDAEKKETKLTNSVNHLSSQFTARMDAVDRLHHGIMVDPLKNDPGTVKTSEGWVEARKEQIRKGYRKSLQRLGYTIDENDQVVPLEEFPSAKPAKGKPGSRYGARVIP